MIKLDSFNLAACESLLCQKALDSSETIIQAADKLGITRHALKRRMTRYKLDSKTTLDRERHSLDRERNSRIIGDIVGGRVGTDEIRQPLSKELLDEYGY